MTRITVNFVQYFSFVINFRPLSAQKLFRHPKKLCLVHPFVIIREFWNSKFPVQTSLSETSKVYMLFPCPRTTLHLAWSYNWSLGRNILSGNIDSRHVGIYNDSNTVSLSVNVFGFRAPSNIELGKQLYHMSVAQLILITVYKRVSWAFRRLIILPCTSRTHVYSNKTTENWGFPLGRCKTWNVFFQFHHFINFISELSPNLIINGGGGFEMTY